MLLIIDLGAIGKTDEQRPEAPVKEDVDMKQEEEAVKDDGAKEVEMVAEAPQAAAPVA